MPLPGPVGAAAIVLRAVVLRDLRVHLPADRVLQARRRTNHLQVLLISLRREHRLSVRAVLIRAAPVINIPSSRPRREPIVSPTAVKSISRRPLSSRSRELRRMACV